MEDESRPLPDNQHPYKRAVRKPPTNAKDLESEARSFMPDIPDPADVRKQAQQRRSESSMSKEEAINMLQEAGMIPSDEGEDENPQNFYEPPKRTPSPSPAVKQTRTGGFEFGAPKTKPNAFVTMLRQKFGVEKIPTVDREIGGINWTFKKAEWRDKLFAKTLALIDSDTTGPLAMTDVYDFAKVCSCIVAIDSIPTWQRLEIVTRPGEHVHDPLFPPHTLQSRAAAQLYDYLIETCEELPDRLIEAYNYEFRNKEVSSYLDFVKDGRFRFVCPHENCDNEIIDILMEDPITKEKKPYFCKFHATAMEIAGEASDYPLM